MNIQESTAALITLLEADEERELWDRIYYMPDGPLRSALLNAWVALNQAVARRHYSAARFGQRWPGCGQSAPRDTKCSVAGQRLSSGPTLANASGGHNSSPFGEPNVMPQRLRPRPALPEPLDDDDENWIASRMADLAVSSQAEMPQREQVPSQEIPSLRVSDLRGDVGPEAQVTAAAKPGDAYRAWFWKNKIFDLVAYQFYNATQILAPSMDAPAGYPHSPSERQEKFDAWMKVRFGK